MTVFHQRTAQGCSTTLVDEVPGSRICLCPSIPLSRIQYCVGLRKSPHVPQSLPHGSRVAWSRPQGESAGDMLAKAAGSGRSTSHGMRGPGDMCGAAPLCSRDSQTPSPGVKTPWSLLPESAHRSIEPKMDDASHGLHVGELETPRRRHSPSPGASLQGAWLPSSQGQENLCGIAGHGSSSISGISGRGQTVTNSAASIGD